jgi:hypothetical protein
MKVHEAPGRFLLLILGLLLLAPTSLGQQKTEKKDGPKVTLVIPLGVTAGKTTRVSVYGVILDKTSALRFHDAKIKAKLLSKKSDTQIEAEVTVPADFKGESASFVVVTTAGETPTHKLLSNAGVEVIGEKDPHNGFAQAQPIRVPQIVNGTIGRPQEVDVYRFEGKTGQRLLFEIQAARYGSPLDSLLTLYDSMGHELASNDDFDESLDSRLEATLPQAGTYYLSVMDARDQGGPTHAYRLVVGPAKAVAGKARAK